MLLGYQEHPIDPKPSVNGSILSLWLLRITCFAFLLGSTESLSHLY